MPHIPPAEFCNPGALARGGGHESAYIILHQATNGVHLCLELQP